MNGFVMRRPFDAHVHLRQAAMLLAVIEYTARWCSYALIMPNLKPRPVLDGDDVRRYRAEILAACQKFPWFTPLLACQIIPGSTSEIIARLESAFAAGAVAAKIYPLGVTNSDFGIADYEALYPVFEYMQKRRMRLLLHGESPDKDLEFLLGEKGFIPILGGIHREFPELPISVEHIGDKEMIDFVLSLGPSVVGGLTLTQMTTYMNHWGKQTFKSNYWMMPAPKYRPDMNAVLEAAISNKKEYRKFRLGSDSAPHLLIDKHATGCAGSFSSPVLFQRLTETFLEQGRLYMLEDFTSTRSCEWYGVEPSKDKVLLVPHEWVVTRENLGLEMEIEPFWMGHTIGYQFEELIAA